MALSSPSLARLAGARARLRPPVRACPGGAWRWPGWSGPSRAPGGGSSSGPRWAPAPCAGACVRPCIRSPVPFLSLVSLPAVPRWHSQACGDGGVGGAGPAPPRVRRVSGVGGVGAGALARFPPPGAARPAPRARPDLVGGAWLGVRVRCVVPAPFSVSGSGLRPRSCHLGQCGCGPRRASGSSGRGRGRSSACACWCGAWYGGAGLASYGCGSWSPGAGISSRAGSAAAWRVFSGRSRPSGSAWGRGGCSPCFWGCPLSAGSGPGQGCVLPSLPAASCGGAVVVCGSRALPTAAVPRVRSVVGSLLAAGRALVVGCAAGADQAALSSALGPGRRVAADGAGRLRAGLAFVACGAGHRARGVVGVGGGAGRPGPPCRGVGVVVGGGWARCVPSCPLGRSLARRRAPGRRLRRRGGAGGLRCGASAAAVAERRWAVVALRLRVVVQRGRRSCVGPAGGGVPGGRGRACRGLRRRGCWPAGAPRRARGVGASRCRDVG
jgi:hypothetical protein